MGTCQSDTVKEKKMSWRTLPRSDWTLVFQGKSYAVHTYPFMHGNGFSEMLNRTFLETRFAPTTETRLDLVADLPPACHREKVIHALLDYVYDARQWKPNDWQLYIPLLRLAKVRSPFFTLSLSQP